MKNCLGQDIFDDGKLYLCIVKDMIMEFYEESDVLCDRGLANAFQITNKTYWHYPWVMCN